MTVPDMVTKRERLQSQSATRALAVTPHDTNYLPFVPRGVYVGTTGDLTVLMENNEQGGLGNVTFTAVPAGTILPISPTKILTSSTASDLVILGGL